MQKSIREIWRHTVFETVTQNFEVLVGLRSLRTDFEEHNVEINREIWRHTVFETVTQNLEVLVAVSDTEVEVAYKHPMIYISDLIGPQQPHPP